MQFGGIDGRLDRGHVRACLQCFEFCIRGDDVCRDRSDIPLGRLQRRQGGDGLCPFAVSLRRDLCGLTFVCVGGFSRGASLAPRGIKAETLAGPTGRPRVLRGSTDRTWRPILEF